MSESPSQEMVELPEAMGVAAAGPLADQLRALQGRPVVLDASRVERVGGLCLQVLLSAVLTWKAAGARITLHNPSAAFAEAWSLYGAPQLSA